MMGSHSIDSNVSLLFNSERWDLDWHSCRKLRVRHGLNVSGAGRSRRHREGGSRLSGPDGDVC
jgi:hypothetical protein